MLRDRHRACAAVQRPTPGGRTRFPCATVATPPSIGNNPTAAADESRKPVPECLTNSPPDHERKSTQEIRL